MKDQMFKETKEIEELNLQDWKEVEVREQDGRVNEFYKIRYRIVLSDSQRDPQSNAVRECHENVLGSQGSLVTPSLHSLIMADGGEGCVRQFNTLAQFLPTDKCFNIGYRCCISQSYVASHYTDKIEYYDFSFFLNTETLVLIEFTHLNLEDTHTLSLGCCLHNIFNVLTNYLTDYYLITDFSTSNLSLQVICCNGLHDLSVFSDKRLFINKLTSFSDCCISFKAISFDVGILSVASHFSCKVNFSRYRFIL